MILGIGTDLVCISAFAEILEDKASHFVPATFTQAERALAQDAVSHAPAQHLAARYAAKEATVKALDAACAFRQAERPTINLGTIEVVKDAVGRPFLKLHHNAAELAGHLRIDRALVSLSHDGDYASAFVVLESFDTP